MNTPFTLHELLRAAGAFGVAGLCAIAATGCDKETKDDRPTLPQTIDEGIFAEGRLGSIRADATEEQREIFKRGEEVALKRFTPQEGLGPRFNVTFCSACHEKPDFGGSGPRYRDFYLFGQSFGDGAFVLEERGGVSHSYGLEDAPLRPPADENTNVIARRNAIPFFGVGAVAALDERAILANADPDDKDGDGISGRPNFDRGFVGRFGRKAQTVSIEGFIRGPLNNHLGITTDPLTFEQQAALPVPSVANDRDQRSRRSPQGLRVDEQAQAAAPAAPLSDDDGVPDPELASGDLFALISWAMLLGAPEPAALNEQTMRGEALFQETQCAACHVPSLQGNEGRIPIYSDLLLHDMGEALADGVPMGLATGSEYRTQPLWGLAATGPYLHDGRADTIDEAIRHHGGEAKASKEAYEALSDAEREDLLAFLRSLGAEDEATEGLMPTNSQPPDAGELGGPLPNLNEEELALWTQGRKLFDRDMHLSEGLGPLFNGDSCRACHFEPTQGGAGPLGVNVVHHGTRSDDEFDLPDSGRTILAKLASPGLPREEAPEEHNVFETRQTPALYGMGLIEQIPVESIEALADPDDADGDGIHGDVRFLEDGRLGRFGWKANVPTTHEFVRDALTQEMGGTVPAEEGQIFGTQTDEDEFADPEFNVDQIAALAFYISRLAPPTPQRDEPEGSALFDDIGCAACHVPSLDSPAGPVNLYSDLLLHDVAPEGYNGVEDGPIDGRHYRTPPLWGMSGTAPYMHDGAATTAEDAIAAHHGEATASRQAYEALSSDERAALLRFLESL